PDGFYMSISVQTGGRRFKARLVGFDAEVLWSPDSSAFVVNEREGGGGFDQKAYIFYLKANGLEKKNLSALVERAFGRPVKCELPIRPNTAVVTWLAPHRLLVAAEIVNVSVCQHPGTFLSYELSLPDLKVMARHTQAETRQKFGKYFGCELAAADDNSAARWQKRKSARSR
ncbi:MAG TPA: hypothetical protein VJA94_11590, partial [Candidatus Angelobacter sp.]